MNNLKLLTTTDLDFGRPTGDLADYPAERFTSFLINDSSNNFETKVRNAWPINPIQHYSEILGKYQFDFRRNDSYLRVGAAPWVQGWILDISVIKPQICNLLDCILPLLLKTNSPFKLVRNSDIAGSVLGGESGYSVLGKIISIYPPDEHNAVQLALQLIELTQSLKGPEILTDRRLSGIIYTRYGAGQPIVKINKNGTEENHIYDPEGNLIKEPLSIPFQLPSGIDWPFTQITSPKTVKKNTVLQDKYRPMVVLKEDAKGSVRKGLFLQASFRVKWCVLKEGRQCMESDQWGRDIKDRLQWQYYLQKDLHEVIPIPKVYDIFDENGNTYLAMEYVRGESLSSIALNIFQGRPWQHLPLEIRLGLLDFAEQILEVIQIIHAKGYIHRDITPVNFLVDKQRKIWMIDMELSYSERSHEPYPPFRLGTPGFMSPEQDDLQTLHFPTIFQDIYSLGATFVHLLTGLFPGAFSPNYTALLIDQLNFLIGDVKWVEVLSRCLSAMPEARPTLASVKIELSEFRNRQSPSREVPDRARTTEIVNKDYLRATVHDALYSLSTEEFMNMDHLWFSRTDEDESMAYYQCTSVSVHKGFYKGLSGIMYVLAKAHSSGFSISSCIGGYKKSLTVIRESFGSDEAGCPGGLYTGNTGMILALAEGVNAGLIENDPGIRHDIQKDLQNEDTAGNGIANGLAGKGLVLLRTVEIFNDPALCVMLNKTVDKLISQQLRDGSWVAITDKNKHKVKPTGFAHGVAGIACFLLEYIKRYKNTTAETAVLKSLQWLIRQSIKKNGHRIWHFNDRVRNTDLSMVNGLAGIILCFVKAYEVLGDPLYQEIAKNAMAAIPENLVKSDLTLATGVVGIGELYLEAAKAFSSDEYKARANWIAQFVLHYFIKPKDRSCFWATEGTPFHMPGLMTGNCGVIHFLIRYFQNGNMSHPLLML